MFSNHDMTTKARTLDVARSHGAGAEARSARNGRACKAVHLDAARLARLRGSMIAVEAIGTLAETFRVLGDSTRVRILDALSKAELCVCDLAALVDLSQSAVSHQLRLLRNMRLVRARRAGRMVFYALDDHHIVELFEQGLQHVEEAAASRRRDTGLKPVNPSGSRLKAHGPRSEKRSEKQPQP
jgi:DNA-binding transcriptional ArsR family regulator